MLLKQPAAGGESRWRDSFLFIFLKQCSNKKVIKRWYTLARLQNTEEKTMQQYLPELSSKIHKNQFLLDLSFFFAASVGGWLWEVLVFWVQHSASYSPWKPAAVISRLLPWPMGSHLWRRCFDDGPASPQAKEAACLLFPDLHGNLCGCGICYLLGT